MIWRSFEEHSGYYATKRSVGARRSGEAAGPSCSAAQTPSGRANEQLQKGELKEAVEALKRGDIDVAVATKLVPVKYAQKQIEETDKLVMDGEYYQRIWSLKPLRTLWS